MSTPVLVEGEHINRPKAWVYVLGAIIAYPVLILLCVVFDFRVLHPELANVDVETTMDKIRWFGMPLLVVAVLFGGKWLYESSMAKKREQASQQKAQQMKAQEAAEHPGKGSRGYVLEVLGLGITVEKYRQGKLWEILQQGNSHTSIREPDPKKYPWAADDKRGETGDRACDALENGADPSPMFWGVPTMYAGGAFGAGKRQPNEIDPMAGLASTAESTGMAWHMFVTGPWRLSERPDQLLEEAFALFDAHPDLPYVVLLAADDEIDRDHGRAPGTPSRIKDGYYIPEMSDASAVFVLARRERVEPLRPYVWDDPDNEYLQENLRMMYYDLKEQVPNSEKLAHPDEPNIGRLPSVAEWLKAAAVFGQQPVYENKATSDVLSAFKRWSHHPPKDWKPTPWFPVPWNRNQMQAFDNLPSLGFIHRPVFVKFEDDHGQPVVRRNERQKILDAGWKEALQTLPEVERAKGPTRIVAAFNNNVEQLVALEGTLHQYAAQGGPEIDSGKSAQFINTDLRMGNTGAATFFVQMALGVMGSYIEGGTSAAINLRDSTGASIVFISPPTEERRKAQKGRDVFKHRVQPSIDPENYKPPAIGKVLGASAVAVQESSAAQH